MTITPTPLNTVRATAPVLQLALLSQVFRSQLADTANLQQQQQLLSSDPLYYLQLQSKRFEEVKAGSFLTHTVYETELRKLALGGGKGIPAGWV